MNRHRLTINLGEKNMYKILFGMISFVLKNIIDLNIHLHGKKSVRTHIFEWQDNG